MNTIQQALDAIRSAESALAQLLRKAIESHEYSEARLLVDAIASVVTAGTQLASGDDPSRDDKSIAGISSPLEGAAQRLHDETPSNRSAKSRAARYPIFERDAERLIKIGWSSKEKRTYEHRVALEVVRAICVGLATAARGGPLLKIEQMQPLKSPNGAEIPSYQVYLVLKWLQDVKAVARKGLDGYVFTTDMSTETIQRLLKATPERGNK
jgi:hypothetical protein